MKLVADDNGRLACKSLITPKRAFSAERQADGSIRLVNWWRKRSRWFVRAKSTVAGWVPRCGSTVPRWSARLEPTKRPDEDFKYGADELLTLDDAGLASLNLSLQVAAP
jgi:hypothetical protein